MKKLLLFILLLLSLIFTISCSTDIQKEHEHSFSGEWSFNETHHYHECVGCKENADNEKHDFYLSGRSFAVDYYKCVVCDYVVEKPHVHSDSGYYEADEKYHRLICSTCSFVLEEEKHDFQYLYSTKDKAYYQCSVCDYVMEEAHVHGYGEYEKHDDSFHIRKCDGCDHEEYEKHDFSDGNGLLKFERNGFIYTFTCNCCGFVKTVNILEIKDSENIGIEVLDETDTSLVFKAKAKEGYHFEKWQAAVKKTDIQASFPDDFYVFEDSEYYETYFPIREIELVNVNSSEFYIYSFKPIYAEGTANVDNVSVEIDNDGNEDIKVDYVLYSAPFNDKVCTHIDYYVHGADAVLWETEAHYGSDGIVRSNERNTLPYYSGRAIGHFGNCKKFKFIFKDTTDRFIVQTGVDIFGKDLVQPEVLLTDENGNVTLQRGCDIYYDGDTHYYYADYWIDSNDNVIGSGKAITTRVDKDEIFYAVMKKADAIYKDGYDNVYLFSKTDGGLTLEGISQLNHRHNVVVPELVDNIPVTGIADYAFIHSLNYHTDISSIEIPESVITISEKAFYGLNCKVDITIKGDKDLTFEQFKKDFEIENGQIDFYSNATFSVTENTLKNMINNLVHTFVDSDITVVFTDVEHLGEDVWGHYEGGSKKICILQTDDITFFSLGVIAHELRHFYQEIAIGGVHGLDGDDLLIKPTDNQIGAWKYLEYISSDEDIYKYWFNAREIDSREYANSVLGFAIQ